MAKATFQNYLSFTQELRREIEDGKKCFFYAIKSRHGIGNSSNKNGLTKEWVMTLDWTLSDEKLASQIMARAKEGAKHTKRNLSNYNQNKNTMGRRRIPNLEPYKDVILKYRKTHTAQQTAEWLKSHCGIICCEATVLRREHKWKGEIERTDYVQKKEIKPTKIRPAEDADLILSLKKRGYRIFQEKYIKRKWCNSYKMKLIEL